MSRSFLILSFFLFSISVISQPQIEWVRMYAGASAQYNGIVDIALEKSGSIFVAGIVQSSGDDSLVIIKYSSLGNMLWKHTIGSPNGIWPYGKLFIDDSGFVYLIGLTTSNHSSFIIKYTTTGNLIWEASSPAGISEVSRPVAVDKFGNVALTAVATNSGGGHDYSVTEFGANGTQRWVNYYDGPIHRDDQPRVVITDIDGNVYVTGSIGVGISSTNTTINHYGTIKYNINGVQQWLVQYPDTVVGGGEAYDMALDNISNLYVIGSNALIRYSLLGSRIWVRLSGYDMLREIVIDNLNNIIGSGTTGPNYHFVTSKYNQNGELLWRNTSFPVNSIQDYNNSLKIDKQNNIYVAGYSYFTNYNSDISLMKYNPSGSLAWIATYDGPVHLIDGAAACVVDSSLSIYVGGGLRVDSSYHTEFVTIKYSQSIGIQKISSNIPGSFSLSQNYPNPFNPNTVIRFQVASYKFVKLTIYDVTGREVVKLVNQQMQPGSYSVDWDALNYPSGVYFYQLTINNEQLAAKRMVLIK